MEKKGVIPRIENDESVDRATQLAGRRDFEKKRLGALAARQRGAARSAARAGRSAEGARRVPPQAARAAARPGGAGGRRPADRGRGRPDRRGRRAPLAKVIAPDQLQAHLRIPETAMQDVAIGLHGEDRYARGHRRMARSRASIRRRRTAASRSTSSSPSPLPPSARVDQNIDGTIELGGTQDVLHIAATGDRRGARDRVAVQARRGGEAHRVTVTFGRAALKDIEIASGLQAGDQVVLSDTSQWHATDRLRIE